MASWNIDESAQTVNVKKTKGDTWRFRVTFKQGGVPIVGITDWLFRMQVRHPRTGNIITGLDLSLGNGIEFTGNDGEIEITAATENLDCNQYPYDLEFERPDGYLRTPFGGKITIANQVTQV